MKFLHISDLHIGKNLNGYSLVEDQKFAFRQIFTICEKEKPNGVLIAGDVYDKGIPTETATEIFDDFLSELSKRVEKVFIVSGNHDSAVRLSYLNRFIKEKGIYIASAYQGETESYTLSDEYGEVCVYLLPFVKPVIVNRFLKDQKAESYTEAVRACVDAMHIDTNKRNILVAHQFVTGGVSSDSEESCSVGGLDNVDGSVFSDFDYVALGHLHRPQNITDTVRYAGTPLAYSFSEKDDKKSVTIFEIREKGNFQITTVPLVPLHNMVELEGKYEELMSLRYYEGKTYTTDYVRIVLTDDDDIINAFSNLKTVYTNIAELRFNNKRSRENDCICVSTDTDKTPFELFSDLFFQQNDTDMTEEQKRLVYETINKIWEEE